MLRLALSALVAALLGSPVAAQTGEARPVLIVAVPPLATPKDEQTPAGTTWAIANQIADLVAKDLQGSGRFLPLDVKSLRSPSFPEVTSPNYRLWRGAGARALVSGFVQAREDGRLTVGCYLYDAHRERELTRKGFVIAPTDWQRAAHKCADAVYTELTGEPALFQTRIAYVEESGPPTARTKRITVQDIDGNGRKYLTLGDAPVMTPVWSPKGDQIAYTSLVAGQLHVRLLDTSTGDNRPLREDGNISFAPVFSPDGNQMLFSTALGGNTDLQLMDMTTGLLRRLTSMPGIDTSASFSPDGRQIAFESDRSGSQQIYVMNVNGSEQRRVSFGPGASASPRWSPDGEHIAFTRIVGPVRRVGVIKPDGSGERILTTGTGDQAPSWGPGGQHVLFQGRDPRSGKTGLFIASLAGGDLREISTPLHAADPAWSRAEE
ncbi:MAG: Tol-Pal system beta propeller repeat protein TolB [Pseudomonadota bacterium]|nr:Tol-Pal system protein TolB [Sphingomonas sp.]MDQ3478819.1 Tol-Pal system beta propeller repeat protein TolB [Pseudomonadota bacterium]